MIPTFIIFPITYSANLHELNNFPNQVRNDIIHTSMFNMQVSDQLILRRLKCVN